MSSLYRKWRSRSFDDLLGQEHVVRTLRNAIANGRVAHAYLFTGPRGTGKTSTARILAKSVNCLHPRDGNACNECEMCLAANEGRALDVIEIDAASNTSVENVRDLRERVAYAAGESRYKVYIVDEVHRLSGAAFDAFLKTLEEPPEHVIFVFASTEPHKVPATITSRCQRFDFRRITPRVTLERLRYVADQEEIEASDGALQIIAQAANGSLRDALGLLDQAAAFTEGEVDAALVRQSLGLTDPLLVARLSEALLDGEVGAGLADIRRFLDAGGDPGQLTRQLIEYWRALLMCSSGGRTLDIDPALAERAEGHARRAGSGQIVGVLRALGEQTFSAKFNLPPELPLEVGYVQAALLMSGHGKAVTEPRAPENAARTSPTTAPAHAVPKQIEPPEVGPTLTDQDRVPSRPPPEAAPSGNGRRDPESAPAAPERATPPAEDGAVSDLDATWATIVRNMRSRSPSLQALLRSGYLLRVGAGELRVGFLYDFHPKQLMETKNRRVLEEVVLETLGTSYRVSCVKVTKEEIESSRGEAVVDDGFVEEVADRLREYHLRQLGNGHS